MSEFYLGGGIEKTLKDLLSGVDVERFEPHFLLKAPPKYVDGLRAALPAVVFHEAKLFSVQPWQDALGRSGLPAPILIIGRLALRVLRDIAFALNIPVLWRFIRKLRPDAVEIINGGFPGGMTCLAACAAGRWARIPWVGLYVLCQPRSRRVGDSFFDWVIRRCVNRVASNARSISEEFAQVHGMPPEMLRTVYTGISAESTAKYEPWRSSPDEIIVGMAAMFSEWKGHRFLLEAAAILKDRLPDLKWVCIGEGPTRASCIERSRALGLEGKVLFPGLCPGSESVAGFDILVHPSLREGLPNVVLEAMRAAKPIVASRVDGIPEQIDDGVNGLLISPGDVQALAAAVERLVQDPNLARRLGDAGRARFLGQFTITHMRQEFFAPHCESKS